MKVVKFGGSSLASAKQIKKVCDIIVSDTKREIVVVSAPGKRNKDDIKVTDLLISCADAYINNGCAEKELKNVISRFESISNELGLDNTVIDEIKDNLSFRISSDCNNADKFMDLLKAAGEDYCARLVAAYLKKQGYEAAYIDPKNAGLLLSNEYGNAQVLKESYESLSLLKDIPGIKVFPGFFGYSKSGDIVTLPRGGSDVTGSILAAAVNAELYENFTDVDSVYAVNPNLVNNPMPITTLTYREMRELSYAGFSVFHEEALEPVYRKGIPVCIKNTNNPSAAGTTIVPALDKISRMVIGVAGDKGFCSIYVSKYLMNRMIGFGRRLLSIFEDEGIPFEHMPSGIDDISIILRQNVLNDKLEKKIINRIKTELGAEDVRIQKNQALVMIVGEGCRKTVGTSARATKALANADINIEMINQGASEVSIMFGVDAKDCDNAVIALYNEFFN